MADFDSGNPEMESQDVEDSLFEDLDETGLVDLDDEELTSDSASDEDDPDDIAEREEQKRREEQSYKDRYYSLLEKEKAQAQPQPTQETAPEADPIVVELMPYIQQLNKLVQEGDITEDDARVRLQEQYAIRKMTAELHNKYNESYGKIRGSENLNVLREEFTKHGITKGSEEEKEAIGLLKNHWNLDINDPNAFATFKDPNQIGQLALYVSAVALTNKQRRNGTEKPAPKGNRGTSTSTPTVGKGNGFQSLREVSEAAKRGILK